MKMSSNFFSEEYGTEHIRVSGGYFLMGNIFFKLNKTDVADSLYRQVTSMWYQYLKEECTKRTDVSELDAILGKSDETELDKESLGKQKKTEKTLHLINYLKSPYTNTTKTKSPSKEKVKMIETLTI